MTMPIRALLMIVTAGVITWGLRAFPFLVFRGNRQMPQKLKELGDILPSAIMAVLIIYCLKDVSTAFWETGLWEVLAAVVTGLSYKWKHNTFLSIIVGTACYMLLIRLPFSLF